MIEVRPVGPRERTVVVAAVLGAAFRDDPVVRYRQAPLRLPLGGPTGWPR